MIKVLSFKIIIYTPWNEIKRRNLYPLILYVQCILCSVLQVNIGHPFQIYLVAKPVRGDKLGVFQSYYLVHVHVLGNALTYPSIFGT